MCTLKKYIVKKKSNEESFSPSEVEYNKVTIYAAQL